MVGGQVFDIQAENKDIDLPTLQNIHKHKTGMLMRAAVRMGAIAAGFAPADALFCQPGTHNKWVATDGGRITEKAAWRDRQQRVADLKEPFVFHFVNLEQSRTGNSFIRDHFFIRLGAWFGSRGWCTRLAVFSGGCAVGRRGVGFLLTCCQEEHRL